MINVHLPDGFNFPQQHIMFVFIEEELYGASGLNGSHRYVKLVRDQDPFNTYSLLDDWINIESPSLWLEKYGELPPSDVHLYGIWAEVLSPDTVPYDGPTQLTDREYGTVCKFVQGSQVDLTVAMLYVMVEGFNWRPGASVGDKPLPSQKEMLRFYHHYATPINDDPQGALQIALSLLVTHPDGKLDAKWHKLGAVVEEAHLEYIAGLTS